MSLFPSWSPSLSSSPAVMVGGGRAASSHTCQVARAFARRLLVSGFSLRVGCAAGVDQAALSGGVSLGLPAGVSVFAVAGQAPQGWAGRASARFAVQCAHAAGFSVSWWSGGGQAVPLVARLMCRSLAALSGSSVAVFFAPGQGSLKVARAALRAGVPVLVSRVGLASAPVLPVASVPVSFLGFSFWLFQAAVQPALF